MPKITHLGKGFSDAVITKQEINSHFIIESDISETLIPEYVYTEYINSLSS